jgi:hypothetical protein
MEKIENRGGVRTSLTKKIGRPKCEPTTIITFRVPVAQKQELKDAINMFLNTKKHGLHSKK